MPPHVPSPRRTILARRLILSAGALGTPYLLLKNRGAFPKLSPGLGTRFCGNGDFITFAARSARELEPARGPVITSAVRVYDADGADPRDDRPGHYVQDGGYSAAVAWIGELLAAPRIAWADKRLLLKLAWGYDYYGDSRTVDVHVTWLREKLRESTARIQTVWGIGYKLVEAEPGEAAPARRRRA